MTFWGAIDSTPSATRHYRNAEPWDDQRRGFNGPHWSSGKQGQQCLALRSDGDRCNEPASEAFPFCGRYHAEHALYAFAEAIASDRWPIGLIDRAMGAFLYRLRKARSRTYEGCLDAIDDEILRRLSEGDTARINHDGQLDRLIQERIEEQWGRIS